MKILTIITASVAFLTTLSLYAAPSETRALSEFLNEEEMAQEFQNMDDYIAPQASEEFEHNVSGDKIQGVPQFPLEWPKSGVKSVTINVNKATQRLTLKANGVVLAIWPVSTGKTGHTTPSFTNRPVLKQVWNYRSHKYNNAPMTWATFITEAIAIHSTPSSNYDDLGQKASHGCIRLTYTKAYWLFNFVAQNRAVTRINVF